MKTAKTFFDEASNLYAQGDIESAIKRLEIAVETFQNDGRLWELAGILYRVQANFEAARHALEVATLCVPLQTSAQCALADCYANEEKHDLARFMYGRILSQPAATSELLLKVASGFERIDEVAMAVKACRLAVYKSPELPEAYYTLGYYLGLMGAPLRIVESMSRKAISLAPERVDYRIGLAGLIASSNDTTRAFQVIADLTLEQIAQIDCLCCLERIGELYTQFGDENRREQCNDRLAELQISSDQREDTSDSREVT